MLKALKENLVLLSLMIILVGTSSTDSYYSSFGLKYQFLNVPASHIFFRGLTAVWAFPLLGIPYIFALALVAGQARVATFFGRRDYLNWCNHAAVAIFVVAAWLGGEYAGFRTAITDMTPDKSTLPLIAKIDLKESVSVSNPSSPTEGYRLLLQNSDGVQIFKTIADPKSETPLVKYISKDAINAISLCARC